MSYKLFIPGPIAVSEKTLRAMAQPTIGHRSTDFVALYQSLQPGLQEIMATKDPVYLSTSSAWGVMEGSLHNVVAKKVLNCMNGAFSDKWYDVALRDGKQATALRFDWGKPVDPEAVRRELATGAYDSLTARLAQVEGFEAVYLTGGGYSRANGYPDMGLLTMTEVISQISRICAAVDVPVISDADNGYGNVLNMIRTVQEFERAGAAGLLAVEIMAGDAAESLRADHLVACVARFLQVGHRR